MSRFTESCIDLRLPKWLGDLSEGNIQHPSAGWGIADYWYPHPPAFVPIIADDSTPMYLGLFRLSCVTPPVTFCLFDLDMGGVLSEIARTPEQLAIYLVIKALGEGVSPERAEEFASMISISDFGNVLGHAMKYGDETSKIGRYFGSMKGLPFDMLDENVYDGSFDPLINNHIGDRRKFYEFIKLGSVELAWGELNARGWVVEDAIGALKTLMAEVQERVFISQCNSWIAQAEQHLGDRY